MTELKDKLTSLRIEKGAGPASRRRGRRWPLWLLGAVVVLGALLALSGKFRGPVEVTTTTPTVITPEQLAAGQPILTASGYLVPRRRAPRSRGGCRSCGSRRGAASRKGR
ncbi:MAG: hypothetical protein MUC67_13615 [Acidobacteria bacterium]|nr:hypothetical protein [Acidobacteriota bacterium]